MRVHTVSQSLLEEIKEELEKITYGSIEVYVQNKIVTQITVRNIKKTGSPLTKEKTDTSSKKIKNRNAHYNTTNGKIRVLTIQK
jgi:hypothetical protein